MIWLRIFLTILLFSSFSSNAAYLDPHNHINGIIKSTDYANLEKVISGEQLTTEELAKLWDALAALYTPSYVKNSRNSMGSINTLTCNEPKDFVTPRLTDQEGYRAILVRNIERMLSATPHTGFDSAYAQRGYIEDSFLFSNLGEEATKKAHQDLRRATLLRLAMDSIAFTEMSTNFIGGDSTGRRFASMYAYENMINDLLSTTTSEENMSLKTILKEKNLPIPKIRWLLMAHSSEFALGDSENNYMTYAQGECQLVQRRPAWKTSPYNDLYKALKNNIVVGIDVAGTENTCFTKDGANNFREFIKVVYAASKERIKENKDSSKLLVHVHVGEGSPILEESIATTKRAACASLSTLPSVKKLDTKAVHAIESAKNIKTVINLIYSIKREIKDAGNYIVFRLGHATNVTRTQAKEIKDLGIEVDVNLSSNIATGSWTVEKAILDTIKTPVPTRLLEHLLKADWQPEAIFGEHGLKWLLYYNVLTILGTDGAGVEHADLARDYQIASSLIDYWNRTDEGFRSFNISIENLINNQNLHMEKMNYPERL